MFRPRKTWYLEDPFGRFLAPGASSYDNVQEVFLDPEATAFWDVGTNGIGSWQRNKQTYGCPLAAVSRSVFNPTAQTACAAIV